MFRTVFTLVLAALFYASSLAQAAEVKREKIAQWGDALTPPQSRTSCIGYASGDWPWGGSWKTCNEWKTEWRHMEVEAFLVVSGPEDLNDAAKKATEECIATAAAAAIGAGFASGGAAAVAAAKVAFPACMATKGQQIADQYSINVETNAHWTDWG